MSRLASRAVATALSSLTLTILVLVNLTGQSIAAGPVAQTKSTTSTGWPAVTRTAAPSTRPLDPLPTYRQTADRLRAADGLDPVSNGAAATVLADTARGDLGLFRALSDPDPVVRHSAVLLAPGARFPEKNLPAINKCLRDAAGFLVEGADSDWDDQARNRSISMLFDIGERSPNVVPCLLSARHADVRLATVDYLLRPGAPLINTIDRSEIEKARKLLEGDLLQLGSRSPPLSLHIESLLRQVPVLVLPDCDAATLRSELKPFIGISGIYGDYSFRKTAAMIANAQPVAATQSAADYLLKYGMMPKEQVGLRDSDPAVRRGAVILWSQAPRTGWPMLNSIVREGLVPPNRDDVRFRSALGKILRIQGGQWVDLEVEKCFSDDRRQQALSMQYLQWISEADVTPSSTGFEARYGADAYGDSRDRYPRVDFSGKLHDPHTTTEELSQFAPKPLSLLTLRSAIGPVSLREWLIAAGISPDSASGAGIGPILLELPQAAPSWDVPPTPTPPTATARPRTFRFDPILPGTILLLSIVGGIAVLFVAIAGPDRQRKPRRL